MTEAIFQEALRKYRRTVTNCDPMQYLADTEAEAVPVSGDAVPF